MHLLLLISGCLLGWTGVWGQYDHHVTKEDKKAMLDDKVVLPCKVFKPDESATVHWLYVIPEDKGEKVQNILTAGPKGTIIENSELKSRIDLKNNSRLQIVNLQVKDNKQFICRVEFQNGVTKESRIQLHVYKSPSEPELKMEQNGIQVTDEAVQIGTCESKNGFPMPVIKWYKSDKPLRDAKDGVKIHTRVATGSDDLITVYSILLAPVQQSDASALFYCDVSYSLPLGDHMLESERKNITVHYPTTSIKVYFKSPSEIIKEGDTVDLICEGNGNPQPSYTLGKKGDDATLTEDLPYSWKVSREDSGVYVCTSLDVDTLMEFKEETTLYVNFLDPPMLSHESPVTVDLQSKLMVSCQVDASNETVIHWKQDGNTIENGSVLNLDFVDYSATGLYTCVADLPNVPGMTTSKDISITVQGSPQASVTSQVIEVQDGETVTTNCTVFGYPQAQVTWYINDTEVTSHAVIYNIKDNQVTSELTLMVHKDFFNQSLKCVAFNRFNNSAAYIQLLEKSMTTPFSVTDFEPMGTRAPEPESRTEKSYGIVIVIVIICILLLAFLGAVLYFLYKKGHIPCGRSGKKDITNPGAKDKIIVEMKPDSPAEESVLLTGPQEKKPSDQEKYIDLRN
ncbi:cell surface glycoprotein MUC18 isoform X2 [Rana temporaria]|uniref:cell surface glycoprotein MUC18 isoform X2 n=1 Tax=Rana temporaria TaxID=8407 RepID=UPI001AAD06B6|nr:cell surface glycoprotein MUC18 isoform X2 [Rana temporaria]